MSPTASRHRSASLAVAVIAAAAIAVPVLAAAASAPSAPSVAPAADPSGGRTAADPSAKPGRGPKADAVPETPVTLTGTVGTRTGADGETVYTLTVAGTVYDLEAGPAWWWGDKHPLKPLVGRRVTIAGEQAKGSNTIDVVTADGTAIRTPGRPPWAGGWKVVGAAHPGWAQWKVDMMAGKRGNAGHGRPSWAGPKASPGAAASDDPND